LALLRFESRPIRGLVVRLAASWRIPVYGRSGAVPQGLPQRRKNWPGEFYSAATFKVYPVRRADDLGPVAKRGRAPVSGPTFLKFSHIGTKDMLGQRKIGRAPSLGNRARKRESSKGAFWPAVRVGSRWTTPQRIQGKGQQTTLARDEALAHRRNTGCRGAKK